MAKEGLLQWMVHYNTYIDKRGVYSLRINYKDCYDLMVDYCIEKNLYYPGLTLEEFKVVLRAKNYCLCYNAPTWFSKEQKSIFKKEVRGAKLDVALL